MDFNFDENILWILGVLVLIFVLFPQRNVKTDLGKSEACAEVSAEECIEEKIEEQVEEQKEYIYRRKNRERRRLVY